MQPDFGNLVANVLGRRFLRHCRREIRAFAPDPIPVVARIRSRAQAVFDASAATRPDPQARMIHAYCSLVLAAFREIRAMTNDEARAYAFARTVFQQTLEGPWRWALRLWLRFVRDPVGFLSRRSLAEWARRSQGASMEFANEKSDDAVELVVRRCAFHQFFVTHGEPALTPVVCAFDSLWMEMIDRSSRPVRTERPSTISTGGDCCRFRLIRDSDKRMGPAADIILIQLQKPPYVVRNNPNG
jgi:L-2-amino-thiazoline-4-carboxylic acid hydrolase